MQAFLTTRVTTYKWKLWTIHVPFEIAGGTDEKITKITVPSPIVCEVQTLGSAQLPPIGIVEMMLNCNGLEKSL